jgi:hypothetical protein
MISIDQLRATIDAKHRKALDALEVLSGYLAESVANGVHANPAPVAKTSPAKKNGSFREMVVGVISQDWASVAAIAQQTGLTIKQVRGVLNGPAIAKLLKRRDNNGVMEYHRPELVAVVD